MIKSLRTCKHPPQGVFLLRRDGNSKEGILGEKAKRTGRGRVGGGGCMTVSRVSATIGFSFLTCQLGSSCFITDETENVPKV